MNLSHPACPTSLNHLLMLYFYLRDNLKLKCNQYTLDITYINNKQKPKKNGAIILHNGS